MAKTRPPVSSRRSEGCGGGGGPSSTGRVRASQASAPRRVSPPPSSPPRTSQSRTRRHGGTRPITADTASCSRSPASATRTRRAASVCSSHPRTIGPAAGRILDHPPPFAGEQLVVPAVPAPIDPIRAARHDLVEDALRVAPPDRLLAVAVLKCVADAGLVAAVHGAADGTT